VSRSEPHMEKGSHQPIEEAAPAAQAIGRGHDTLPALGELSFPSGRRQGYPFLLLDSRSKPSTRGWRGPSSVGTLMGYDTC
jgi:hypothetical protein